VEGQQKYTYKKGGEIKSYSILQLFFYSNILEYNKDTFTFSNGKIIWVGRFFQSEFFGLTNIIYFYLIQV
jgi:hypothetical protein